MNFLKAQGLGNDFMMIDISSMPEYNWKNIALYLSNRRYGVGFDQLILFKNYKVWFYNNDGSTAESCGNGVRCLAYYLMKKSNLTTIDIETPGGVVLCSLNKDDTVTVQMPYPTNVEKYEITSINLPSSRTEGEAIQSQLLSGLLRCTRNDESELCNDEIMKINRDDLFKYPPVYACVGNPHLVCFVEKENLEDIHVHGPLLSKQNVNVSFVNVSDPKILQLKVWERGTGLTPACGSGACASVVAAHYYNLVDKNVLVQQEGGSLDIYFDKEKLLMTGMAHIVFEGYIDMEKYEWVF